MFTLPNFVGKAGQFQESKHPRVRTGPHGGEFGHGSGGHAVRTHVGGRAKVPSKPSSAKPPPLPLRHNPLLDALFSEPTPEKPAASTAALRANPLLEELFGQSVPKPPLEHDPAYKPDTPFRTPGTGKPPANLGNPKSVDEARDQLVWLLGRATIIREQGRKTGRLGKKPAKELTLAINLANRLRHQFFRSQQAAQAKAEEKKPGAKSFRLPRR